MSDTAPLPPPDHLGRYQLVELLGQGGMGEVWLAKLSGERGFEKACLVKTVLPQLAKDRQFVERFEHEAKVLTLLQHSNIAQVYDMGEADGRLFMALEYITGVDVAQLADAAHREGLLLPVPVALFIGWQAAEGLGYAHRKTALDGTPLKVVHRDVTPQNVMVSFEGEVKVIDFGIARSAAKAQSTQTSTVMGKLGYMSPEQARAEPVDSTTDQYALAVVVWELLTGITYIPDGTTAEMMTGMAYPKVRSLMGKRADVDAELDQVLLKALALTPAERYPTTDDFGRALLQQLTRLGGPPPKAQVGQYVQTRCADAFQTTRRLLSKVSTLAKLAPAGPPATEPVAAGKKTVQTRGALATPAVPEGAAADLSALHPKRGAGKTVAIALATLVLLAGAGLAAFKLWPKPEPGAGPVVVAPPPLVKADEKPPPVGPPPEDIDAKREPLAEPKPPPERLGEDAAPPDAGAPAAPELLEVKKTAQLFEEKGGTFVRAGTGSGLKPGQTLAVLGPKLEGDLYPVLGRATVKQVFSKLTQVSLDEQAAGSSGERWVALAEKKGESVSKLPRKLSVGLELSSGRAGKVVTLTNNGGITLSHCTVFVPGRLAFALPALAPKFSRTVALSAFHPDPSAPALQEMVELRCPEGSLRLPAR